jgi:hypothetical protein
MGRTICLLMVLVLTRAALATAAEVQPSEQVRFITRDSTPPRTRHPATPARTCAS